MQYFEYETSGSGLAHLETARVYAYLGNADKAREHIGKAVELNPKSPDSLDDGDILRTLIAVD